jgi:hypothetical protein
MDAQLNNRIRDVWTSAAHRHIAFTYPHDQPRFNEMLGNSRAPLEQ